MLLKLIKIACIVGSVTFLLHAILVLFCQPAEGGQFFISIILLGYAVLLFSFLRRQSWSWLLVFISTPANLFTSIFVPPTVYFYGSLILLAQIFVLIQSLACTIIFVSMLLPATKIWFTGSEAVENISKEEFHMGEILEITYRNNLLDLVWFNLYQTPRSRTMQISYVLLILMTTFLLFPILSNLEYSFGIKTLVYVIILTSILIGSNLLKYIILILWYVVRQFDIRATQACKLSVSDNGALSETPFKNKGTKWSGIEKIQQTSRYIMLFLSDREALLIPKRVFANKFDAEKFFDYSHTCFEKSRNESQPK